MLAIQGGKGSAIRVVVILWLAASCGDGGGLGVPPTVALAFPPPVSSTDAESITVRGTASDPSGVAEVRVNGVLASTTDGFATWQADVPLALGMNTLTVAASDARGNSDAAAEARIESQAFLVWPTAIAVDPWSPLAFVLDDRDSIKSVDLTSGVRSVVSDRRRGSGPSLRDCQGIAIDGSRALLVSTLNYAGTLIASVIAVDLVSGDRTILSDDSHGIGPSFDYLQAITIDVDRALVTSYRPVASATGAVVAVDLVSGDRTILSDPTLGSGPALRAPGGIVVDGSRALVLDTTLDAVVAVDLASGDRTIVSDASTGTGPLWSPYYRQGITLDGGRVLIVDTGPEAVLAVDLVSGDRTFLVHPPGGELNSYPLSIALDVTDGTRALVAHARQRAIVGVDLSSGERTFVSPPTSVGTGPSIHPSVIALEEDLALVTGDAFTLVAVDLASGARRTVSDPSTGIGPRFGYPDGVVLDGERALVLATNFDSQDKDDDDALFAVDLASGDRSIVSDSTTGEGRMFDDAGDMVLAGNRVLVTYGGVMAVDLGTGDRTIVSDRSRGQGPHFLDEQGGMVLDGNRVIVGDASDTNFRLVAVDLASGDRSIVSGEFKGEGPLFRETDDLLLDGDRVLVVSRGSIMAVDLATGDRTIVAGLSTGLEPVQPRGIARSGDRVYVTDPSLGILALDPRTGQRTIVAR